MVFYRKYRPQKLFELVGQGHISQALLSQLESGKIGHGYLFYGTRGTGKTSTARILAKAVNCEIYSKGIGLRDKGLGVKFGEPCNRCLSCVSITNGSNLDLIEIDAASNRGIDEIRDLREKVKLSPVSSRFKVYIIDEAHMLTNEAFNALLKTLEEPPTHAIFILATTELSKLPSTIVSRLQKFNFSRAGNKEIIQACLGIAKKEGIKIDDESLEAIAQAADGSFRDAVSILDQLSSRSGQIRKDDVLAIAKVSGKNLVYKFLTDVANFRLSTVVLEIEEIAQSGGDIVLFARQAVLILEKVLFVKIGVEDLSISDLDDKDYVKLKNLADIFELEKLQELMRLIISAELEIKLYPIAQIPLILALCKFCADSSGNITKGSEIGSNPDVSQTSGRSPLVGKKSVVLETVAEELKVVEKATSEKSKALKNSTSGFSDIEKNWQEFLNKVRPLNAHVVALLRSTKPLDYDGESLMLEVFYRFHKDKLEEPKIVRMLDSVLEEVMGKTIKLKFSLAKRDSKPTITVNKSDVIDVKADELEMIAQEIFSK